MAKLSDEQIVAAWKAPYERKNEDSWFVEFARAIESAARREMATEIHTALSKAIKSGPLPGNGLDETAERNGIILAANTVLALAEKEAK